jgi:hypothetical protein
MTYVTREDLQFFRRSNLISSSAQWRAERLPHANIRSRCGTAPLLQNDRTWRLSSTFISLMVAAPPPCPPVRLHPNPPWNDSASPHHRPQWTSVAAQGQEEARRRLYPPSSRRPLRRRRSPSSAFKFAQVVTHLAQEAEFAQTM